MILVGEARDVIVAVLCSQALADHLGDVRDAEDKLWGLIGVPKLPYDHAAFDEDSAFSVAKARLELAGLELPEHLRFE